MLSRVADSIFWMSRYMERSTTILRVARTHYIASQDDMKDFGWRSLLETYTWDGEHRPPLPEDERPQSALRHLILDRSNDASVVNNIMKARENARAIQDNITKELWQCLNDYHHLVREPGIESGLCGGDPVSSLDLLLKQSTFYYGTVDSTMARGEGFNFLNIGKFLERAMQTADIIKWKLAGGFDGADLSDRTGWRYCLLSLSGYELYLKTYRGTFRPDLAVEQTVLNGGFPHSIIYCLGQVHRYFERLQAESLEESYRALDFQIGKTMNIVRYSNVNGGTKEALEELLSVVQKELLTIAFDFNRCYFGAHH